MKALKRNWIYIVGAIIGAIGGFMYWKFIGCASGTCPLTSSPYISTIYGAVLGTLVGGIFRRKESVEKE